MHFRLETDASGYATGAVLSQLCNYEKWHPVGFASKILNPEECNYAIYDKELLSVICGLKEWRHILEGTKHTIEILNNHKNLTYFQTAQNLNLVFESLVQPSFFDSQAGNWGRVNCLAPTFHQKPGSDRYRLTPSNPVAV